MADFDPSQPFDTDDNSGFNPSAPFDVVKNDAPAESSALGAFGRRALNAIPFGWGDEIAATGSGQLKGAQALLHGQDPFKAFGDEYNRSTSVDGYQQRQDQQQHPIASTAGSISGGVVGGVLGGLATGGVSALAKLGGYGKGIVDAGIQGSLTALGDSDDKSAKDALVGGGVGAAAGAVLPPVIKGAGVAAKYAYEGGKDLLGWGAQIPQRALDSAAGFVGSHMPAMLKSGETNLPKLKSAQMRALQNIVDKETGAAGGSLDTARAVIGDGVLEKQFSDLSPDEARKFSQGVASALKANGIPATEEAIAAKVGQIAQSVQPDMPATADDMLRMIVKHDPANVAKRVMTSHKAYEGLVPEQAPEWNQAAGMMGKLRGDFEAGQLNRGFGPAGQVHPKAVDYTGRMAPDAVTAEEPFESFRHQLDKPWNEWEQFAEGEIQKAKARYPVDHFEPKEFNMPIQSKVGTRAEGLGGSIEQPSAVTATVEKSNPTNVDDFRFPDPKKGQRGFIDFSRQPQPEMNSQQAMQALRNISEGRRALKAVGAGGGAIGGNIGALLGVPAAEGMVDALGVGGQLLQRSAKNALSPGKLNTSYLMNPNALQHIASGGGPMSGVAKWALDGAQSGGAEGVTARSYVLSMQPEIRQMLANHPAMAQSTETADQPE